MGIPALFGFCSVVSSRNFHVLAKEGRKGTATAHTEWAERPQKIKKPECKATLRRRTGLRSNEVQSVF
jgi:hypothetical protein